MNLTKPNNRRGPITTYENFLLLKTKIKPKVIQIAPTQNGETSLIT